MSNQAPATINLHRYGYAALPASFEYLGLKKANGLVSFVDDGTIAVAFVVPSPDSGLGKRNDVGNAGWIFRTVLFDIGSGKAKGQWDWRNATEDSSLLVGSDGTILVSGGGRIDAHNRSGTLLWTRNLPRTDVVRSRPYAHTVLSSSGATVFAIADSQDTEVINAYRVADGTPVGALSIPFQGVLGPQAASDHGFAYITKDMPYAVEYSQISGTAPIRLWTCRDAFCAYRMTFVGNDRIVLNDTAHSVTTIDSTGRMVARASMGNGTVAMISASSHDSRLLIKIQQFRGGSKLFDIFPKIANISLSIRDSGTLREVGTVGIDGDNAASMAGAAINGSGELVAYVLDGEIHFCSVRRN